MLIYQQVRLFMVNRYKEFTTIINKLSRYIIKIKATAMEIKGLKCTHVSCLYYLYKSQSPLTLTELANYCEEDKAAISRAVDYLIKNNYLKREYSGKKAYRSPIVLTELGENTGKYINENIDNVLNKVSNGISDDERLTMYKCLNTITENLKTICKEYGEENGNKVNN